MTRLLTLALMLLPAAAQACAVCGAANERNRVAFLATTGFLSLLPLGMIAGGVLWLRRHAPNLFRQDLEDETAVDPESARIGR